ncbi:ABC transporter substrate-binding protein [Neorhizobium tomejilense]|uniref:ABC transporter substrate-binding protein n=1 Tax=Neorhizobium tomejilense TaxID=2093828 RepID=UPI003ED0E960
MLNKLTFTIFSSAFLAASVAAHARDLTVVSAGGIFQDAQRQVYFDPFRKQADIPLAEDSWDGGIGVLRSKVGSGDANNWDVVEVESEEEALGCEEGLFETMDPALIGGLDRYIPGSVTECGVPANIFSIVLAYDGASIKAGPKTWADVFDTTKFPGKRAFRSGPKMNLEFALIADGVAPSEVYKVLSTPAGVDRAFAKLDTIKKDIVWWTAGNQPMQLLGSGEVAMTTSYNGRIGAANRDNKRDFRIMWAGNILNVDSWVILKGTPNKDQATKLVEFLGRPDRQVEWPAKLGYGVGSIEAQQKLPAVLAATLPTAPEHLAVGLKLDANYWIDNIDALNTRFATWAAQ